MASVAIDDLNAFCTSGLPNWALETPAMETAETTFTSPVTVGTVVGAAVGVTVEAVDGGCVGSSFAWLS